MEIIILSVQLHERGEGIGQSLKRKISASTRSAWMLFNERYSGDYYLRRES